MSSPGSTEPTLRELARRTPATAVWAVLMVATVVSSYLGDGHGGRRAATVAIIGVAFAKALLVGLYFMELRGAPRPLRLVFATWAVVVAGVLVAMYLSSGPP